MSFRAALDMARDKGVDVILINEVWQPLIAIADRATVLQFFSVWACPNPITVGK